jgi:hypothetical protein
MAFIVQEGANVRKTDHVSGEYCDQPLAQVDPHLPVMKGTYAEAQM